jgi:hypothetical protein
MCKASEGWQRRKLKMMKVQRSGLVSIGSAAVVGIAALAFAVTAFTSRTSPIPDKRVNHNVQPLSASAAGALSPAQSDEIVVERVTFFPYGFEPEEITRPAGTFLLAVDNRAGTEDFSFQLVSGLNQLVHTATIRRGYATTSKLLTLAPGTYVLREPNYPKWTCTITITPN